jgi:serine/threonine protein kinase
MSEKLSHIGCFQIEEALGRGAFKTMYRAINRDSAKNGYPERVALCIPHMQDEESRRLLQNEYRIVNALSHPSIVRIYGVEEIEGSFFAVMELVEGETVASLLKRHGALPLEEAIMITERVADALDYAHEALAFHRDIKPANIMILKDKGEKDSPGVKVLGFTSGDRSGWMPISALRILSNYREGIQAQRSRRRLYPPCTMHFLTTDVMSISMTSRRP